MPRARLIAVLLLAACHGATTVTGLYVSTAHRGWFFPCKSATEYWQVADTALATRYASVATRPNELVFVRLSGMKSDSSGIYGPDGRGRYHFLVRRIIEVRTRGPRECAGVLALAAPLVTTTP